MRHSHGWMTAVILLVSGLLLSACTPVVEEEPSGNGPARVEPIEGTDLVRVTMTAGAAERLDMQTAPVRNAREAGKARGSRALIPYAAVFYGPTGDAWTYTSPQPLTFVRAPIKIDRIDGDLVLLSDGPPSGTEVVTRGAAELFGIETGVDES